MNQQEWIEYFELVNGRKPTPAELAQAQAAGKKMEDCYHCIAWTCCDSLDSHRRGKILEVSRELYSRWYLSDDKIRG